jgi:hypothetical protein
MGLTELALKIRNYLDLNLQGNLTLNLDMMPLSVIEKALEEIGFEKLEDEERNTNGWEIDFWYEYYHPGYTEYTVSGSLWYGDFKISKS